MSKRLSGFRKPEAAIRYREFYDDFAARLWPVPHEELDVTTRFGSTHVRRSGAPQGAPLVLIHPTTGSSLGWYRFIAPLCEAHPVYTPDTIGTAGRSVQSAPLRSRPRSCRLARRRARRPRARVGPCRGLFRGRVDRHGPRRPHRAPGSTLEPHAHRAGGRHRADLARAARHDDRQGRGHAAVEGPARPIRDFNRWLNGDVQLSDDEIELLLLVFTSFRQSLPMPKRLGDDELRRIAAPVLVLLGGHSRLYDPEKVAALRAAC